MAEAGIESQNNHETIIDSVEQESRNEHAFYTLLDRMRVVAPRARE